MFRNPIVQLVYHGAGCLAACYVFFYLVVGVPHPQAFILAAVTVVALASTVVGFVCADRMVGLPMKSNRENKPRAASPCQSGCGLNLARTKKLSA